MNRGKESIVQKALLCNIRISSEDTLSQSRKSASKSASRSGISPSKNNIQKELEVPVSKVVNTKVRISKQNSSRANSADKLCSPLAGGLKIKSRLNGKIEAKLNKPAEQQENIKLQESPRKDVSPNKERPLRGISKTREGQLRKEALEVVSEENEEYFRETLNGLSKKGTMSHSKSVQRIQKDPLTPISNTKRTEFVLHELFSVKTKVGAFEKEEEIESPLKNQNLEIETMPTFRQSDENNMSPKRQTENDIINNNFKSPSNVRGVFMKEHISNLERQKEQDQRKLMREYLDSQVNEKKRLKEEEKLRQREESKKEESRIKMEVEKINMLYEKELNTGKGRQQEAKVDPLIKDSRNNYSRKEDRMEMKNKEQDRESYNKEFNPNPTKSIKSEILKEEPMTRKETSEQQTLPIVNIRKLTEENKHLRDQNFRKNELIDMLLVALKNQGKDGITASELLEADLFASDSHSRSNSRQKLMVQSRNGDNFELNHYRKEASEGRSNNSPWVVEGTHFLRYETDNPELEEPFDFEDAQLAPYKATETLSKLVNPSGLSEIKLPAIPDFYSHRKGPSFLSNSNLQQLDTLNVGQPSSRFPATPYTKVSPRQFSLNISSPTNSSNMKQKGDIFTLNPTPKPFTRMTHFSRSKLEEGPIIEPISVARSGLDFESHRVSSSASQTNPKKLSDSNFLPAVQFPAFRNSTANNQRMIVEIRNPIRVVDMGNHQQVQTTRSKGGYIERPENQLARATVEEMKDPRLQLLMKEKEPRRDFLSIGIESNSEKGDYREDLGMKRIESLSNRNKFPKEVFCLNLRKKVGI